MIAAISCLSTKQKTYLAILVAALGYFVDVYDLVLFSVVRIESLKSLGFSGDELLSKGVLLLNMQMMGMLVGGILWGIWGDKRGRIQVLFGSILLYSLANIANAWVDTVTQYAVVRFIAGLGLAGEIGAGITLVSELMPKEKRGYGTTIVATVGVSGAIVAGLVGDFFPWRTAYIVGGCMGLVLLILRVSVHESGLFDSLRERTQVARGNLRMLFGSWERVGRYLNSIVCGIPIWFVVGIIVTFCTEIGAALGITEPLKASQAVIYCYIGLTLGDLSTGLLSQFLKSRKKVILLCVVMTFVLSMMILGVRTNSAGWYYGWLLVLGFFIGYWAVFISMAAEQFGTNLRATVATTAPNFVRGTTILCASFFNAFKGDLGVLASAQIICISVSALALLATLKLRETFGRDLNFVEE